MQINVIYIFTYWNNRNNMQLDGLIWEILLLRFFYNIDA